MISISELRKSFGKLDVLRGVSLDIPKGQSTGIVGPNGAGKTTLIKSILGLTRPDSGSIFINEIQLNGKSDYRNDIGYMPQVARYPETMRVRELLDFIKGLRRQDAVHEQELIEQFNLGPELDKMLRNLSGGNRQKVGATISMMFDPSILFFDEPTAGLDPRASARFKQRVEMEKSRGKTVFITSHIMSELEQLVDYVIFILDGNVRYYGPVDELLKSSGEVRLENAIAQMMDES